MRRINENWLNAQRDLFKAYQEAIRTQQVPPKIEVVSGESIILKWLIGSMANLGIPFQVINLGAGVKKVTTDVNVCPKCHGTGKC
jgi:intergrase/recombinase